MGTTGLRPLDGLCVVDCTQMLSGPFATQLLVDMGADDLDRVVPDDG